MFVRCISAWLLASSVISVIAQSVPCNRPDGVTGECISVYSCKSVLRRLRLNISASEWQELRSLQCESNVGRSPHVCCFESNSSQTPASTTAQPILRGRIDSENGIVLPSTCSSAPDLDHRLYDRVFGGIVAQLSDCPWTVLLEYQSKSKPQERKKSCGGSLINNRYVITAAHCLVGEIERKIGTLVGVRLGEFDLTKDIDCIGSDCADPIISVGVEEKIPHPGYNERDIHRHNDIGLVRMDQDITYTEYIKPICLPSTINDSSHSHTNGSLASAGWGRTQSRRQSETKQIVALPLFEQAQCVQQYSAIGIVVDDTQFCAGGVKGEDTCDGDSGNALFKYSIASASWVIIEGVVSYGRKCGVENRAAVYTRVSAFEPWIRSNLRP